MTKEMKIAVRDIAPKHVYYSQIVNIRCVIIIDYTGNNGRTFIPEGNKTRTNIWVSLEEYWLEDNFIFHEIMLYNHFFSE